MTSLLIGSELCSCPGCGTRPVEMPTSFVRFAGCGVTGSAWRWRRRIAVRRCLIQSCTIQSSAIWCRRMIVFATRHSATRRSAMAQAPFGKVPVALVAEQLAQLVAGLRLDAFVFVTLLHVQRIELRAEFLLRGFIGVTTLQQDLAQLGLLHGAQVRHGREHFGRRHHAHARVRRRGWRRLGSAIERIQQGKQNQAVA